MTDRTTVWRGGRLIDGQGTPPVEDSLIVVDGDPLEHIAVPRDRSRISGVYKGGQAAPRLSM